MAELEEITLRSVLHRTARYFGNNEALVDAHNRYTYAETLDLVQRTAALLHSLGVRKGDRVALMTLPSPVHVIALFGIIELGAIPVTLHAREKAPVLAKVLTRLMPRTLIYYETLADTVGELRQLMPEITSFVCARSGGEQKVAVDDLCIPDDLHRFELDFEPMPIAASDTVAIVLTSGTTGVPKGVMHSHRGMVEGARGAVSVEVSTLVALGSWLVGGAALLAILLSSGVVRRLASVLLAAALLALIVAGPFAWYQIESLEDRSRYVVLAAVVEARSGPGEQYKTTFTVHEGLVVVSRGAASGWTHVRLPNALVGWLPTGSLERI